MRDKIGYWSSRIRMLLNNSDIKPSRKIIWQRQGDNAYQAGNTIYACTSITI